MPRPPAPRVRRVPYWIVMLMTSGILGGITLVFVLVVLPQRFVLQGGLRASGVSFPASALAFSPGPVEMLTAPAWSPPAEVDPAVRADSAARPDPADLADPAIRAARTDETAPEPQDPRRSGEFEPAAQSDPTPPSGLASDVAGGNTVPDGNGVAAGHSVADGGPVPDAEPDDLLAQARKAVAEDDLALATRLWTSVLGEDPDNPALLLEWADVLQYRLEDPEGALSILRSRGDLIELDAADRFRIAQLLVWIGEEEAPAAELARVLALDPDHAEAWALSGELHRWAGNRFQAADAYQLALALDSGNAMALEGLEAVREDTRTAVRFIDGPALSPRLTFFRDTDGFERSELLFRGAMLPYPEALSLTIGMRRMEGFDLDGAARTDEGGTIELTAARWWREGGIRGAFSLGADRSSLGGTEVLARLRAQFLDFRGWILDATLGSGPAHTLASTLESAAAGLRADQMRLDVYRQLPGAVELSGSVDGARFSGMGDPVNRLGGGLALTRVMTPWLRAGVNTRYVSFSGPAPVLAHRRLFWDPESFWSTGAMLELRTPPERGPLSAYLRGTPGIALARERGGPGRETVAQFEAEGGLRYTGRAYSISMELFQARGRDGGYMSRGFSLGAEVRR